MISKNLIFSLVNARSVKNKIHQLQYELINKNIDLCAMTETWLQNNDIIVDQIPPPGYHIVSHPRSDGCRGGGVALIYKDGIKVSDHKYNIDEKILQCCKFNIKVGGNVLDLLVIYRQPATSVIKFCEELALIFESDIASMHGKLMLTSDFNIHMELMRDPDTITFMHFLDCFNLQTM